MFLVRELHLSYGERSIVGVCHKGVSRGSFHSVTRREWKVFVVRVLPYCYKEAWNGRGLS